MIVRPHMKGIAARIGAVLSTCSMLIAAAVTFSAARAVQADAGGAGGNLITQDVIAISLPIFVVSMLAAIGFTWAVASAYWRFERKIDALMSQRHGRRGTRIPRDLDETPH